MTTPIEDLELLRESLQGVVQFMLPWHIEPVRLAYERLRLALTQAQTPSTQTTPLWKPLFPQEPGVPHTDIAEGEPYLFALRVSQNGDGDAWEYFTDSIVWDGETAPEFRHDVSGWSVTDVEFFAPIGGLPEIKPEETEYVDILEGEPKDP